jgi:hypothetical protein
MHARKKTAIQQAAPAWLQAKAKRGQVKPLLSVYKMELRGQ